jgi:Flp pilus assembly protein TadD
MPTPFLSSEEFDERAHDLYNEGDYEAAMETLKEGLRFYPHSVELYVGLGYARLAREEFVWAKQAFDKALVLDPEHEDARVGLGEVLLRFGQHEEAQRLFAEARELGGDDVELLMSMGRALYRERLFDAAHEVFTEAAALAPDSADAAAALGYVLHRMGNEAAARRQLTRALRLDVEHHEARLYLGHLHYDRGDWELALREFEAVPPMEHWDPVSVWRLLELKRALAGTDGGDTSVPGWEARLAELELDPDPIDELLEEVERTVGGEPQLELFGLLDREAHSVRTADGLLLSGTWFDIVRLLRDARGLPGETVPDFMRRLAEEEFRLSGSPLPTDDPEAFVRASARAGQLRIES